MKGTPTGRYECVTCGDEHIVSDAKAFDGGFMPAAVMLDTPHPMYWRDTA